MNALKRMVQACFAAAGLRVTRMAPPPMEQDIDQDELFVRLYAECAPFTMTSRARMYAAYQAAQYAARAGIDGAIVECGIWRGGSSMIMAKTLVAEGSTGRDFYLYDTYEGMPEPTARDVDHRGVDARVVMEEAGVPEMQAWCHASIEDVRANMATTGYPEAKLQFVRGLVEQTLPGVVPASIAVLRLDTDWYASTRHELIHLFPLLVQGGVLILDDYGFWKGQREAVDEYFREQGIAPLLQRIDDAGRLAIRVTQR